MDHLTAEQIVARSFDGTLNPAEGRSIEEHLHACPSCRAELSAVERTLSAVSGFDVPGRGDGYGAEVWARIQPRLGEAPPRWWHVPELLAPWRLAFSGGVAALIVAAFVAGHVKPARPAAPASPAAADAVASQAQQVREGILILAVGDYLERSQIALVDLVNSPTGAQVDLSEEQERARQLVTENRLYRQTALTTGDRGMATVLDDLERVLVEIANGPSTVSGAEFDRVRGRIEQQGIIFKVRVFGERLRERDARLVADVRLRG